MDYERGLDQLKYRAKDTDWYLDFTLYEGRLRENIQFERLYGTNEQTRSTRAQIIDQLNRLAYNHLSISFNDLCQQHMKQSLPPETGFIADRKNKISAGKTIETHPQSSIYPSNSAVQSQHPYAFISYSQKDRRYLNELHTHLKRDTRMGNIDYWDGTKIPPGARWYKEIEKSLKATTVAVLLISADFLASDFITTKEIPPLLTAAEHRGTTILCVILRPCGFQETEFAQFQTVNAPSRPLSAMSKGKRDEIWARTAKLITDSQWQAQGERSVNGEATHPD